MDSYTGKRVSGRLGFSRGGNTLSFRDPNQEDRSTQYCSRLGCSSRLNSMKGNQGSNQEKMNYSKTPFRSTSGKAAAGSSSRSSSSCSSDFRKTHQGGPNHKFLRETVIAESSSRQGELEEESDSSSRLGETDDSEFGSVASSNQAVLPDQEELESPILQGISSNSCTATPSSRPHKQLNRLLGSSKQDTSGSSLRRSSVSRNTSGAKKPISQGMSSGAPRYGLKNLGCTSISDVFPSGCSSSDVSNSRKVGLIRKRGYDGGSSSTGLVKKSGYSAGGNSGSLGRGLSGLLSERSSPQQASRRARNQPANRDGAVSVRTRRAPGGEARVRSPKQEVDNIVAPSETVAIIQLPPNQDSIMDSVPESSSRYFPEDLPPVARNNTFGRLGTSGRSARTRSSPRVDDSSTQIFRGPPGDRETYRRFNMEGIAEVLLALERIEQDEELTYEQLLVLETNLFLGGLSFHDQHRDMRMDIDNMSYEELLALEEKMGTVSTALSEESLAKCLRKSIYGPVSLLPGITCRGDDDIKCSICQEEYVAGDELGRLACEHRYHVACIHAWLRQKNCCPICKVSISPS